MSLHFRWLKRDKTKCYNVILSRLVALLLLFWVFWVSCVSLHSCRWRHFLKLLAALFRRCSCRGLTDNQLTQRKASQRMASQLGFFIGRKRRNDIWTHFHNIEVEKKTKCVVENDGEKCGHKITGKNTTNLKRHLMTFIFF